METDDYGFVTYPYKIARAIKATKASLNELVRNEYIFLFPSGVAVILDHNINNSIQPSRIHKSVRPKELNLVQCENGRYVFVEKDQQDNKVENEERVDELTRQGRYKSATNTKTGGYGDEAGAKQAGNNDATNSLHKCNNSEVGPNQDSINTDSKLQQNGNNFDSKLLPNITEQNITEENSTQQQDEIVEMRNKMILLRKVGVSEGSARPLAAKYSSSQIDAACKAAENVKARNKAGYVIACLNNGINDDSSISSFYVPCPCCNNGKNTYPLGYISQDSEDHPVVTCPVCNGKNKSDKIGYVLKESILLCANG